MKILLLGRNGQVGWELQRALQPLGEVIALDRSQNADGLSGDLSKNTRGIPLMQSKNQLIDYVLSKYHIANHQLYAVASNLQEEPVQDASSEQEIKKRFLEFKRMNNKFYNSKKLMPDSVYNNFMKKNTPKP